MITTSPTKAILEELTTFLRIKDGAIDAYLDWLHERFDALEPELRAFVSEPGRFERLGEQAEHLVDQYPQPTDRPALFGLPIGVKDIFRVEGFETRAGSKLPAQVLAGDQAASVSALREAGGLILGKTATTEFAYFAPGPTRNPHHSGHTPGGSSSGSAAAVATGLTPIALGTQTIGSINRPAAFCGVVGYKPTYARISTEGVIPLSPSLDHIGYFTPDAASAAWIAPLLVSSWIELEPTEAKLLLGVPTGPYLKKADPAAMRQFETDCGRLRSAGYEVIEIPAMGDFEAIAERHNLILAAEAAKVHQSWFGAFNEEYHSKTVELILRGEAISNEALQEGLRGQGALRSTLENLMNEHGIAAWVTPSAPGPAPKGLESTGDPVMNLPWTYSGMPTVTLPSGKTPDGLPLGIQLIARSGQDEQLLIWADQLEGCLEYESLHCLGELLDMLR